MTKERMVEHHTHYREIHGYDQTVWLTNSEHELLHRRLRKEGLCNVPVEDLSKISKAAIGRTAKRKKYNKIYKKSNIQNIDFYESLLPNIRLHERIIYNKILGSVGYYAGFNIHNGSYLVVSI